MNLPELLRRAQWGKLSEGELSDVVRMISSKKDADLYTLIQILGRAGSPKFRKIVEPYLSNVGDPQLSALAVKVLCWSWGLLPEYREEMLRFLDGVDWDVDDYVKIQTIGTVGEYLREKSDIELLQRIYDVFSNERERPIIRSAAYFALCRSQKLEWRDIPPASRLVDFSTEIDQEVLKKVRGKLRGGLH